MPQSNFMNLSNAWLLPHDRAGFGFCYQGAERGVCRDTIGTMPEPTDEQIAAAIESLDSAAELAAAAGADLTQYHAYLEAGMVEHAYEALRQAVAQVNMPFSFFVAMSRVAEALGLRP